MPTRRQWSCTGVAFHSARACVRAALARAAASTGACAAASAAVAANASVGCGRLHDERVVEIEQQALFTPGSVMA